MNHKNEGKNPPAAAGNQSRSNQASFPASDLQDEGNAEQPVPRPTLLFVVNVDWFFLSHRLPIALAAKKAGFHVVVTAADTGKGEVICSYGLEFRPLLISRSSFNPIREVCALANLIILYQCSQWARIHLLESRQRASTASFGEVALPVGASSSKKHHHLSESR